MQHSIIHDNLSLAKFRLCSYVPQKLYWYLMGEAKAVSAVTSEYTTVEQCLESGKQVVAMLEQLGVVATNAVTLQIGSGLGRVEAHLCRRVRRCYGLDVSPSMVRKARALVREPNVEFVCGDGKGLGGWDDASLDLIYSFLVFQHLPRPLVRKYICESARKLKPSGAFVFQVPVDETGSEPEPPVSHPYGLRYYTRAGIKQMLADAGFSGITSFSMDGNPDEGAQRSDTVFRARLAS